MADKRFLDTCLKRHNEYRKRHQVPQMKLNTCMSAVAQKWAEHLAKTNTFAHSKDREVDGKKMGENIAMKYTSSGDDFTGEQVTDQWYSEVQKYNFNGTGGGGGTGHFTQVVWKESVELGVGKAQTQDGKWLVVANYLPAGNFMGKYKENVFPAKDGKIDLLTQEGGGAKPAEKGGLFSRFTSKAQDEKPSHSVHEAKPVAFASGGPPGTTQTVKMQSRGGTTTYTKTVVTETTVGPDGQKRTVTREMVTSDHDQMHGASNFSEKFKSLGFRESGSGFPSSSSHKMTEAQQTSAKKDAKKPQKMKDFMDDVIKTHNKYRKSHGKVGDVKHNKELSLLAQKWADHLAATSVLGHSNDMWQGKQLGENVATKWSSVGADYTGQEVTEQWYSEVSKYDWRSATFTSGTGHFSQVVWKGSKEVGIGKAFGTDGRVFVVCNYSPAGNVMGQFKENVFPA